MAYDEGVAQRVREIVRERPGITERKMFGGLAFMTQGHMFIGVVGDTLMVRVGPGFYAEALTMSHVREMDFTGRPMKGYVYVDPKGIESGEALQYWVQRSYALAASMPPKPAKEKPGKIAKKGDSPDFPTGAGR